jgi:hypothetical protein
LNVAFLRLLIAEVRKIVSPQTTGLEWASPGIGVRHTMCSPFEPSHLSGSRCPSATPDACGPRNDGQLPAAGAARGKVPRVGATVLVMRRSAIVCARL